VGSEQSVKVRTKWQKAQKNGPVGFAILADVVQNSYQSLALENLGRTESFAGTSDLLATLEREHAWFLRALDVGPPKSTS
jgi:hypothetical protein